MMRTISVCLSLTLWAMAPIALPAQTYTTLYNFCAQSGCLDGSYPYGTPLQSIEGDLYGATFTGGSGSFGTIYKITPGGAFTSVYDFCNTEGVCPQSIEPYAPLIQSADGTFYGTTGGVTPPAFGTAGAIFEMKDGQVTTLYTFCAQSGCADGANPSGGLVRAGSGDLYGTTLYGGECGYEFYCGTVFKLTPSGTLTTLYEFCKNGGTTCPDGRYPVYGLVQTANGDLYGETAQGGGTGHGTLFKITPGGTLTTVYSFCSQAGCPDGYGPQGLTLGASGDLWGMLEYGGAVCNDINGLGTIFKLTASGQFKTVYTFCLEGGDSFAPLTLGSDGNFYGTTAEGGPLGLGTIFRLTPGGALTTLYSAGVTTLMQDTSGDFYGTTGGGGSNCLPGGCGTIFRLSVGLGPFVKTLPVAGKAGAAVKILGTDLTGASSVTFGGVPAAFTVKSAVLITAAVPAGATSGAVQVVTPGGTLSSNTVFTVTP
ncbi:MAG: choice-of-anchor tandem repeat GloVer-containing protein [Bryobacteraceae bacterium]|jgi:uncharacterized repeat protein (TIGR03803 family)